MRLDLASGYATFLWAYLCCSGATVPSLIDSGGLELWRNRRIASSTIWANPTMYLSQSTVQPSAKAVSRHKT